MKTILDYTKQEKYFLFLERVIILLVIVVMPIIASIFIQNLFLLYFLSFYLGLIVLSACYLVINKIVSHNSFLQWNNSSSSQNSTNSQIKYEKKNKKKVKKRIYEDKPH
jgi:amino acid permease